MPTVRFQGDKRAGHNTSRLRIRDNNGVDREISIGDVVDIPQADFDRLSNFLLFTASTDPIVAPPHIDDLFVSGGLGNNGDILVSQGQSTLPQFRQFMAGLPFVASHSAHVGGQVNATIAGGTVTDGQTRLSHPVGVDCYDIRLVFQNWQQGVAPVGEVSGANAISIRAGAESPDGTIVPVFFNGKRDVTIDPDGTAISDPLPFAASKGDTIWTRTRFTVTAGQTVPATRSAVHGSWPGEAVETGAGTVDRTLSGTIPTVSGPVTGYGPTAIVGRPRSSLMPPPTVALIGDSFVDGYRDYVYGGGREGGYLARYLDAAKVSFLTLGRVSETGQNFAGLATSWRRRQQMSGFTHAYVLYGNNDLYVPRTLAQIQADLLTIWRFAQARSVKVIAATIPPRSTSTDNWATTTGQTTSTGNAVRLQLNAWLRDGSPIDATTGAAAAVGATTNVLRAGQSNHPLSTSSAAPMGYHELADVMETARDSGIWKVPGRTATLNTTSGSFTATLASGTLQVGDVIFGAGIPANTTVTSISGTTIGLAFAPTATATGVAVTTAHTPDGMHPSSGMHALIQAAMPANLIA
jgi:lysophospholipase L1-like esterase